MCTGCAIISARTDASSSYCWSIKPPFPGVVSFKRSRSMAKISSMMPLHSEESQSLCHSRRLFQLSRG